METTIRLLYHGECDHYADVDMSSQFCRKKYFPIYDPLTDRHLLIAVCADYLRNEYRDRVINEHKTSNGLYVHRSAIENIKYNQWGYKQIILNILTSKVTDYHNYNRAFFGNLNGDITDITVEYEICKEFGLSMHITITDAIELSRSRRWMKYEIFPKIKFWINHRGKLKKYKTLYADLIKSVKNAEYEYDQDKFDIAINDIFIKILHIKTKS